MALAVSVRYMINDVPAAIRFYTTLLGFTLERDASPAFASVIRDGVRLLLSGEGSSGKRPLLEAFYQGLGHCALLFRRNLAIHPCHLRHQSGG